jgi:hypothetical protein
MSIYSRTSLIVNQQPKQCGLVPYYYRCRNCDTNLTSNVPADQYQRLKLIQNTVRVGSSLYTMNLGALTTSGGNPTNVSWNQMSDRAVASVQKSTVPTTKSTRHSSTSSRPGGQNPGGIGCDIKHNSYERRLNRLKGKALLKRGPVPANFGDPIVSTRADPVSGGKTMTTNIVTSCVCSTANQNRLYIDPNNYNLEPLTYTFEAAQQVYAIQNRNNFYSVATILTVYDNGTSYLVLFGDGSQETKMISELRIYYPCVCAE